MRSFVLVLAALVLAMSLAPAATVRVPYQVQIHDFDSLARIATITDIEDRLFLMEGIYGPDAARKPLAAGVLCSVAEYGDVFQPTGPMC